MTCASEPTSKPLAFLHPSLNLPRAALIRKNTNSVASEYELGESIVGEGAYSTVISGRNKHSGIERAIKVIGKKTTDEEAFKVELESLMALDHPHIVDILQYFDEGDNFYIVFEMIDGPDLVQYIIQRAIATEQLVAEKELSIILRQVLKAILSCHEEGIIHRDVKLENFMISGTEMVVKMIDLGLAATPEHPLTATSDTVIGTYRYMAPEIFNSTNKCDTAVDMWALGVSFYTLLTLEPLLPDEKEDVMKLLAKPKYVADKIKACKVLKQRQLSKDARDFLNRLLTYDPKKRISADEALHHPFIENSENRVLDTMQRVKKIISANGSGILSNMEAFAKASALERIARLAIASTISHTPDKELIEVRLMFRTLNKSGNGKLSLSEMTDALQREGVALPPNFPEVFTVCASSGNATLNFKEFIACNIPDRFLNEQLCATVFRLLDRSEDGLLEPDDFKIMYASGGAKAPELCEDIILKATGKTSITSAEFCKFMLG